MNNRADILNELKEIAPVLSTYKEHDFLPAVPEGYFNSLEGSVFNKLAVYEELQTISPAVANIKMNEVRPAVPAHYFTTFQDLISAILGNPVLSQFDKNIDVPAGYFDSFADNVMTKIKSEEAEITKGKLVPVKRGRIVRMFSRIRRREKSSRRMRRGR